MHGFARAARLFSPVLALCGCLLAPACRPESEMDGTTQWQGTVEQQDGTTLIRTRSGSVWRAPVHLDTLFTLDQEGRGPPLADIRGVAATDERIYVLDIQEAALHIYDTTGAHLRTVGRQGEGPGEFRRPIDLALDRDRNRIFIRDARLRRITVLAPDGSLLAAWSTPTVPGLRRPMTATDDGALFLPITVNPEDPPGAWRHGMAGFGPEGPGGDTIAPPDTDCPVREVSFAGTTRGSISLPVPFSPETVWAFSPGRRLIYGCSDSYRIHIRLPDGNRRIVQCDGWDRVPVKPEEAEWHQGMLTTRIRLDVPGWSWDGPAVPDAKPAFVDFFTDRQDRLWVVRQGVGRRPAGGVQSPEDPLDYFRRPAWEDTHVLDAFDGAGRYLGRVELPPEIRVQPRPWIDGDRMVAVVETATGALEVRAFRMVVPS